MDCAARPLTGLKGVGPKLAEKLARLKLRAVQDLLFHLPLRYQDRTRVLPIGALRVGIETGIRGTVELSDVAYRGRRSLVCRVSDNTGAVYLRFFYFSGAQQAQWVRGRKVQCFGEVRMGPSGLEMIHPETTFYDDAPPPISDTLTPIYPATEGVSQIGLRKLIAQALRDCAPALANETPMPDLQPGQYDLADALRYVHAPPRDAELAQLQAAQHPAQQRLLFEELLAHHLSLRSLRRRSEQLHAIPVRADGALAKKLIAQLPFALTDAQQRVLTEVRHDLRASTPMQRLLQGDVGCGKTVVAALAAADAIEAGVQVALMAPTELLAEQHLQTWKRWFDALGVAVAFVSGSQRAAERRAVLAAIEQGTAAAVIGTHALFQEGVSFHSLGLMIVDEQHRFGVDQRLALREKGVKHGRHPHQLVMSATPIPRTIAQTLYGDLDVSIIDALPPGRTPVQTVTVPETRRAEVVERVRQACRDGRQVYWVCPLIEESEALQLQTATETYAALVQALPDLRVALVHGRLRPAEKEQAMRDFKAHNIDVLVATTVIEVGVDVPNASLMIIENAERLGLSQLHQLRGRVGRGAAASACVLLYRAPLSSHARERLHCMRETQDGFVIAQRDLEMRGPGEMFGQRQTGLAELRIADLVRDQALLPQVARAAEKLWREDPAAAEKIIARWFGSKRLYGDV